MVLGREWEKGGVRGGIGGVMLKKGWEGTLRRKECGKLIAESLWSGRQDYVSVLLRSPLRLISNTLTKKSTQTKGLKRLSKNL